MAQSGSKASIWNPRFSSRRRAPFWLEAMRATILRSPQFARDRKHLLRQHLAQTVAALVGRHQQADLAQVPEPAGFAVMQAAIAEQLAIPISKTPPAPAPCPNRGCAGGAPPAGGPRPGAGTSGFRRDAGCHSRATCHPARRARWCPGRLRFPEACAPDPRPDPSYHQEEQVVFRLLFDERLKGAAILGGHEAQGDTCAPDLGNPGKVRWAVWRDMKAPSRVSACGRPGAAWAAAGTAWRPHRAAPFGRSRDWTHRAGQPRPTTWKAPRTWAGLP